MRELRIIVGSLVKIIGMCIVIGSVVFGISNSMDSLSVGEFASLGEAWIVLQRPIYLALGGLFVLWCGMRLRGTV